MNNKLETKYIAFIKRISETPVDEINRGWAKEIAIEAKELHAELMASGYGK